MTLPWVRLESNIAGHDKVLALISAKPPAVAWQAAFSYVCSLGYCGGHGTDGAIPFGALGFVHGTRRTAELLVTHGLWFPTPTGWSIPNYGQRQQDSFTTDIKRAEWSRAGRKGACVRYHGADCGCWEESA